MAKTKDARVFRLDEFDPYAKRLDIICAAGDLNLMVDWDDVNHPETATLLAKVLHILNAHWDDPYDGPQIQMPPTDGSLDDEAYEEAFERAGEMADSLMRTLGPQERTR